MFWRFASGATAQTAAQTALEATERTLRFSRQNDRMLLTVTSILGIAIVVAATIIPYVAWMSMPQVNVMRHDQSRAQNATIHAVPTDRQEEAA